MYFLPEYVQSGARIHRDVFLFTYRLPLCDEAHLVQLGQTNLFRGEKNAWLIILYKHQPPVSQRESVLGQGAYRLEGFFRFMDLLGTVIKT